MKTIAWFYTVIIVVNLQTQSCAQEKKEQKKEINNIEKMEKSKEEWKQILSPVQFFVTRENGTERPFTGEYDEFFEEGTYVCSCCKLELFDSDTKFNSGCGWPSFYDLKSNKNVILKKDYTHGMTRVEVRCARCDAHLGHVFEDGPNIFQFRKRICQMFKNMMQGDNVE
ncbi:MAG: peptide-methionine (R)-S-oxide reductase MsrB [Bacteroidales bacterium]|nr:peptide-methionine (R)-S-oxide reductase MsrB [Bacteroidales bacterium]